MIQLWCCKEKLVVQCTSHLPLQEKESVLKISWYCRINHPLFNIYQIDKIDPVAFRRNDFMLFAFLTLCILFASWLMTNFLKCAMPSSSSLYRAKYTRTKRKDESLSREPAEYNSSHILGDLVVSIGQCAGLQVERSRFNS